MWHQAEDKGGGGCVCEKVSPYFELHRARNPGDERYFGGHEGAYICARGGAGGAIFHENLAGGFFGVFGVNGPPQKNEWHRPLLSLHIFHILEKHISKQKKKSVNGLGAIIIIIIIY